MKSDKKRFRFTIRAKLFLLSITILSIPYIGYEYLRELERYLRTTLEISLLDSARALAGPLHENYQLFPYDEQIDEKSLFVHSLTHPIQVDGYADDWLGYLDWSNTYSLYPENDESFSYKLIIGQDDHYLYTMIQVQDDHVVYRNLSSESLVDGDFVELVTGDDYQVKQRYYFSTSAPGRFNPFQIEKVIDEWEELEFDRPVTNIAAEWQQTENGYNLEMAIPVQFIDKYMGFVIADVDSEKIRHIKHSIGTAGQDTSEKPGRLIQPSANIERIIKRLESTKGRRVWVLGNQGQVLASSGSLVTDIIYHPMNFLYSFILPSISRRFKDDLAGASRLQGQEILSALNGKSESRWRQSPDEKAVIVSAASPVWVNDEVRGVVVVEETTNNIQMLQRNALVSLFNKTLLVFAFITLLLLIFASRLSIRLRRLSNEAGAAIDEHGRVVNSIPASTASDEIGDLSRNYSAMLDRLREYNTYLEGLAGKLSHELRTPMAVVQSSLENLQIEFQNEPHQYLERAKEGIDRLNLLVSRLSEASRIEQALQTAEFENFELGKILSNCIEGYRLAYPDKKFDLDLPDEPAIRSISPDLFIQMMDKLINNAVDFSTSDKPIEVSLSNDGNSNLTITNHGSVLPTEMQSSLFNSMVSVRDKKDDEPHLGLGLYIAKNIAEIHGGTISAKNIENDSGVCFTINFH